ncbi:lipocalin-like domain-containing protein [Rhizobium jaguaris]|uniref:Iron ABC transporter permease n=1 Tax=Rhizobium jaguaris TaxID=1312183 RepID=A0A387FUK1_9HYPH|nr:lipocalin-like domain-containing protein [Rhizobium jaguaris]AYG62248.1 iron ABC transporter permease [Rhizobium jaguaris]
MNVSICSILALGLLVGSAAGGHTQGFAGLGSTAQGFAVPKPGMHFHFPADHAPHPDFRIEWWYVTANLKGTDGLDYGAQWTLFRSAAAPGEKAGWSSPQVWMGNAAVTTPDRQFSAERTARGGIGQAGVTITPFDAWIDEWALKATSVAVGSDELSKLTMSATGTDFGYQLNLEAKGPVVPQGDNGYSVKSAEGQASYYYSQPFYSISGTLRLAGKSVEVTGKAWLDREWSSQPLAVDQKGWDWFSLHFDDGSKMMGFRLRDTSGGGFTSGTWISPDGKPTDIASNELKVTPLKNALAAGRDVPVEWRLELPEKNLDFTVSALNNDSWVRSQFPYWEGPIRISGNRSGVGYLEMTGY